MSKRLPSVPVVRRRRPGVRRHWTEAEKAAYLAAFTRSAASATGFCRATGVPRATFMLWQREARAARAAQGPRRRGGPSGFAAVELVTAADAAALPALGKTPPLTLVVRGPGGVAAELTGVDAATAVLLVRLVLTGLSSAR